MTRHILSAFALMALLLSCQREEEPRSAKNIAFSIDEVTRATIINSKTDYVALSNNSLVVAAYQGSNLIIPEQDVTYSSTTQQWSTSTDYPWPTDASDAMKTMTFYSWTPLADGQGEVTLTQSSGSASFDYEAQTEASKQKDIMFGYYSGVSATGVAPLTFKHALAAVKFKVGSIASGCTVDDVYITGIADNGTCSVTFPGTFSWDIDGATKTKSYHPEDTDANPGYGVLSEGSQIGKNAVTLVPQSMTSTAKITFKITPSGGGQETYDISLASSVDLKAGYVTTYKINMAKNVSFDVTVVPWNTDFEEEKEFNTTTNYVLNITDNFTDLPETGGNMSFSVESYASKDGSSTANALPWTLEYYNASTGNWLPLDASSAPSSLFDDTHTFSAFNGTGTNTPGSSESITVGVKAGAQETVEITQEEHTQKLRGATSVGTMDNPYDLSMHTVNGAARSANAPVTANCYVVAAPGWYCFPLVYGNSYNGSTTPNTAAYAPSATTSKAAYLTPFRNAVGTINASSGGIIETDTGVTLTTASVQWEDLPEAGTSTMVGNLEVISAPAGAPLSCKYMRFFISPDTIRQGNIILKVTDGTTTYWSWHIWVNDNSISTLPVRYGNNDNTTVNMMVFNLGWCDGSSTTINQFAGGELRIRVRQTSPRAPEAADELKIVRKNKIITLISNDGGSVYYEWGRKDPMMAGAHISSFATKPYLGSYNRIDRSSTINVHTIAFSIQNPGTFLGDNNSPKNFWYYEGVGTGTTKATYQNLWDATATGDTDKETVKTIYDPCPPGFKVPRKNAYNYFSTTTKIGDFDAGYLFKKTSSDTDGMFFYAAGYRHHETGALGSMSTWGHYWTSSATTAGNAYLLRIYNGTVEKSSSQQQCNGYSIRPVEE